MHCHVCNVAQTLFVTYSMVDGRYTSQTRRRINRKNWWYTYDTYLYYWQTTMMMTIKTTYKPSVYPSIQFSPLYHYNSEHSPNREWDPTLPTLFGPFHSLSELGGGWFRPQPLTPYHNLLPITCTSPSTGKWSPPRPLKHNTVSPYSIILVRRSVRSASYRMSTEYWIGSDYRRSCQLQTCSTAVVFSSPGSSSSPQDVGMSKLLSSKS